MTKTTQVLVYQYVDPDDELPEGAVIVEDEALQKTMRLHYEAMQWAIENRGAILYINGFLPSLQMPGHRTETYAFTEALLEACAEDVEANGPTETHTRLVQIQKTVDVPEEPRIVTPTQVTAEEPPIQDKSIGGFGLIVPGR